MERIDEESPRLTHLREHLTTGGASHQEALTTFWAEVRARGTPLIEPVASDPTSSLVTFLWRGTLADGLLALLGQSSAGT